MLLIMKRFLFFMTILFAFTLTVNAQYYEWVGASGGPDGWGDPNNWMDDNGEPGVPGFGADVNIGGSGVYVYYDPVEVDLFNSVSVYDGATILVTTPITVIDNFYLDINSSVEMYFDDINYDYDGIIEVLGGTYDIYGSIIPYFGGSNYMPQIGDQIVVATAGNSGSTCGSFGFENFIFNDNGVSKFEVIYVAVCDSPNQMTINISDINYTGAKSWDGEGGNGLWTDPANWDPNGVPMPDDYVIINKIGGSTVLTGGISQDRVSVGQNNILSVNGNIELSHAIHVTETASVIWTAGNLKKRIDGDFPSFYNWGTLAVNGIGIIDTGTLVNQDNGVIEMNGDININDGRLYNFNGGTININFDDLTIGFTSAGEHILSNSYNSTIEKTSTSGPGTSTINVDGFEIFNGGILSSQQGTLAIGEGFINAGILTGVGNFMLPTTYIENGTLAPGNSPGILNFIGNLTTSEIAKFNIEIDGPTAGTEYDQIIVTNEAILDGTINVILGYLPADDASFEVLVAANLSECKFANQTTTEFNGTPYTFDIICHNNVLYLNGPGATLNIPEFEAEALIVYPNPTTTILNIKSAGNLQGTWKLFNSLGQLVLNGKIENINTTINTQGISAGFYALHIKDEKNNTVKVSRVIKK